MDEGPQPPDDDHQQKNSGANRILVVLAHGFGLGLLKPAPGTWGSLLGLPVAWVMGQLDPLVASAVWIVLFLLGVKACDAAAAWFQRKDPGQCVIDEYVAMGLIAILLPLGPADLVLMFVSFRVFDIFKPWPIKSFEKLPGGWGVMADDVVAALYATATMWALFTIMH